ncbi:MAG: hypothetical protein DI570_06120 [Phenylobacterium zucineum]|nr:MAG: hypothetical protein DI570_06120 [Phenylobacterium zucineum]
MRKLLLSCTALAGVAFASAAFAAESAQIEEVVVTAQKRAENVQDVPLAVTALTDDALASANIGSVIDIKRLATSVQYAENATVRGTGLQIRGVGTQSFSNGLEQSVGTVVDGVVMARNGMGDGDLVDIDHIEVLRGPQGMLFGKNASAGVVSVITRRPTDTFGAEGRVSFGTYNDLRLSGVVNLPLGERTALRVAAFTNTRDGIVKNNFDNSQINDHQESGVKAKFLWRSADDNLQIYLIADRTVRDNSCCLWTVRSVVPGSLLANSLAAAGIKPGPDNRRVNLNAGGFSRSVNEGVSGEVNWEVGGHTLTSLTAFRRWHLRENADSDSTPVAALDLNFGRSDEEQFSQELRLASPSGQRVEYVVGLYYFDAELLGNNGQQGSFNLAAAAPVASRYFIATNKTRSEAVFGQATFRVTDALRLIAGARYTHDKVSMDFFRSFYPGTTPSSPPITLNPSTSANNTSWRLGAQYDLTSDVMAYATVSRGYKGPGFNALQGANAAAMRPVQPEIPKGYELGLKSTLFDRRLVLNVAVFNTRFENFQAQFYDPSVPPLGAFILGNAGELRTKGAEVEWTARPTANLSISGGVSYNKAVYTDFKNAACWGTPATQPGCAGGIFDATGTRLPNSPRWSHSLQVRYEREVADNLNGFVSANWYGRSKVNDSLGDPNMERKAYGLVGGSIGVEDAEGRWQASAWVRNLFDHQYTGAILATPLSPGSYSQYPVVDAHRMVGVALTYRFGG